jgi:putative methionine-R-sulfoxide reductase with GAF domain
MTQSKVFEKIETILRQNITRTAKAAQISGVIRAEGAYRWVGLYDVDIQKRLVSNIAWSGPNAPAFPTFPITKGLTSRAIATKTTVNVGDVASDPSYLTALVSTRSEIIVPVLDAAQHCVIGTIDVESAHLNAFDSASQSLLEECVRAFADFWTKRD